MLASVSPFDKKLPQSNVANRTNDNILVPRQEHGGMGVLQGLLWSFKVSFLIRYLHYAFYNVFTLIRLSFVYLQCVSLFIVRILTEKKLRCLSVLNGKQGV